MAAAAGPSRMEARIAALYGQRGDAAKAEPAARRTRVRQQDAAPRKRRFAKSSGGRMCRQGIHERLVLGLGVRARTARVEGARLAALHFARSGKASRGVTGRRSRPRSHALHTTPPVAGAVSAKRAPVMNERTSSPRSANPFATVSNAVTCPCSEFIVMIMDDIAAPPRLALHLDLGSESIHSIHHSNILARPRGRIYRSFVRSASGTDAYSGRRSRSGTLRRRGSARPLR